MLPRLVELGLARRRKVEQTHRPDKQLYRITRAGRRRSTTGSGPSSRALARPSTSSCSSGGLTSTETLVEQVEQYRRERLELLEELARDRADEHAARARPLHWFLLRLGIDDAEQDVQWADWVLAELEAEPGGPIA